MDTLTIIAMTAAAYVGTNIDNLLLLIAFYSRYLAQSRLVTAGYATGMLLIGLLVFVLGEAGDFIPVAYLGSLGVIPIFIGVKSLADQYRKRMSDTDGQVDVPDSQRTIFLSVLLTQLSNSADTIITFTVFQFDSKDTVDFVISGTFFVMIFVFATVAFHSLKNQALKNFLARYGHWLTPFVLILVGLYIINDTATDLVT